MEGWIKGRAVIQYLGFKNSVRVAHELRCVYTWVNATIFAQLIASLGDKGLEL